MTARHTAISYALLATVFCACTVPTFTFAPDDGGAPDLGLDAGANRTDDAGTLPAFSVTGAVSGELRGPVELALGGERITVPVGATHFEFSEALPDRSAWAVTVMAEPPAQHCAVTPEMGVIHSADGVVTLSCEDKSFVVGGIARGIRGPVVVTTGAQMVEISTDGAFAFPSPMKTQTPYAVSVVSEPPTVRCSVANAEGMVDAADVTNVEVSCLVKHWLIFSFVRSGADADIYAVQEDGTNGIMLADSAQVEFPAIAASNGRPRHTSLLTAQDRLIYLREVSDDALILYSVHFDGSGRVPLSSTPGVTRGCAVIEGKVVFYDSTGLWAVNPDGTLPVRLGPGTCVGHQGQVVVGSSAAGTYAVDVLSGQSTFLTVAETSEAWPAGNRWILRQPIGVTSILMTGSGEVPLYRGPMFGAGENDSDMVVGDARVFWLGGNGVSASAFGSAAFDGSAPLSYPTMGLHSNLRQTSHGVLAPFSGRPAVPDATVFFAEAGGSVDLPFSAVGLIQAERVIARTGMAAPFGLISFGADGSALVTLDADIDEKVDGRFGRAIESPMTGEVGFLKSVGGVAQCFLSKTDGSQLRQVTAGGAAKMCLSVSGGRLVYAENDDIWSIGLDGTNPQPLAVTPKREQVLASWYTENPSLGMGPAVVRGQVFYFEEGAVVGTGDLYRQPVEGGAPQRLGQNITSFSSLVGVVQF